jgi:hypothetical protein
MRFFRLPSLKFVLCGAVALFASVLPLSAAKAAADIPPVWGYFPLWTNAVATTVLATNYYHAGIDVDQGKVLVIYPSINTSSASTSNVVFGFRTSLDGTLWTPSIPYTATATLTGASSNVTACVVGTNIQARFIAWDKVDNSTALTTTTIYSVGYAWLPAVGR